MKKIAMSFFNPADLIEEVKKRPGLYRTEHPPDREEKLALWKEIGAAIYHDWESYNKATAYDKVLQLQRKWRSLRDAYNRELRARRSGIRQNRRVYKYFKRMSFLGGFVGSVSEDEEDVGESTHSNFEDDNDHIPEPIKIKKPTKRVRKREPSSESNHPLEELEMPMFPMEITNEGSDSDSDKLFLLSFLPEMRQLPLNIKMWVRAQIANIMQEAVTCHYNDTQPGTLEKNGTDVKTRHDIE